MIQILYFASIREQLNCSEEEIALRDDTNTIAGLIQNLANRGNQWQDIFSQKNQRVLFSVNQELAKIDQVIDDGDEVAFFPQVTGG